MNEEKRKAKSQLLSNLIRRINEKRDELVRLEGETEERLKEASERYMEKISEFQAQLEGKRPEENVKEFFEKLEVKETELQVWEENLAKMSKEVGEYETDLIERENELKKARSKIEGLFTKFSRAAYASIKTQVDTLKQRNEVLIQRAERLSKEREWLKDRINSFKAAQKEIEARNG